MKRTQTVGPITALLLLLSVACALPAQDQVTVVAKHHKFDPETVTVKVGTTVRWENREKRQYHSVYFEALGDPAGDYFFPGEFRERTFSEPGTYDYICEPHYKSHNMKGMVKVVE